MSSHRLCGRFIGARLPIAGRMAALVATSFFLVATSQYQPAQPPNANTSGQVCSHVDLKASYWVTGSCGAAGEIVLVSPANECAITVQTPAELALPAAGRFDSGGGSSVSLSNGGWTLSGYLAEGAATSAPVFDAGTFTVTKDGGAAPSGPVPHGTLVLRKCRAVSQPSGGISLECTDGSTNCSGSVCAKGSVPACTASLNP